MENYTVKLWHVIVKRLGDDRTTDLYATTKEEAEKLEARYPVSNGVKFAGMYSAEGADYLVARSAIESGCSWLYHGTSDPWAVKMDYEASHKGSPRGSIRG